MQQDWWERRRAGFGDGHACQQQLQRPSARHSPVHASIMVTLQHHTCRRRFGASAPAPVLYEKFGITTDAVVAAAKSL